MLSAGVEPAVSVWRARFASARGLRDPSGGDVWHREEDGRVWDTSADRKIGHPGAFGIGWRSWIVGAPASAAVIVSGLYLAVRVLSVPHGQEGSFVLPSAEGSAVLVTVSGSREGSAHGSW